jgi:hypothetical protein
MRCKRPKVGRISLLDIRTLQAGPAGTDHLMGAPERSASEKCVRQFSEKAGDRYFARTKDRLSAGRARQAHEAQAGHFGRGHFFGYG